MKFKWPFVRRSVYRRAELRLEHLDAAYDATLEALRQENNQLRAQLQKAGTAHQQSIELFNRHLTRLAQAGNQ